MVFVNDNIMRRPFHAQIHTKSDVVVTVKMNGKYVDLTVDIPSSFHQPMTDGTRGLCGTYDDNAAISNEYYPHDTQAEFIEEYRYTNCMYIDY